MDYNEATKGFSYLILDTCWWLKLPLPKYSIVLNQLKEKVESGDIRLLVPDIILQEWKRHRETHINDIRIQIAESINSANGLLAYLNKIDKQIFKRDLIAIKKNSINIAESRYTDVCNLIENYSIQIGVSDSSKEKAIDFALAKKMPFKHKNSMADALIIFSAIEYLSNEDFCGKNNAIFASLNYKDFSKGKTDQYKIHEDLKDEFDSVGLKYEFNIFEVIGKSEELKLQFEETLEQEWWDNIISDFEWQSEVERGR
jgi:PIN domain